MSAQISIYQLRTKFVNQREDIPEDARQVVYYTLAVGHHVGVLDCFSSIAEVSVDEFANWLDLQPQGSGRSKLEGVLKWGEIEINRTHVSQLLPLLEEVDSTAVVDVTASEPAMVATVAPMPEWVGLLAQCLHCMLQEPAYYLMLRKRI
jgi:hypothetical protein